MAPLAVGKLRLCQLGHRGKFARGPAVQGVRRVQQPHGGAAVAQGQHLPALPLAVLLPQGPVELWPTGGAPRMFVESGNKASEDGCSTQLLHAKDSSMIHVKNDQQSNQFPLIYSKAMQGIAALSRGYDAMLPRQGVWV